MYYVAYNEQQIAAAHCATVHVPAGSTDPAAAKRKVLRESTSMSTMCDALERHQ